MKNKDKRYSEKKLKGEYAISNSGFTNMFQGLLLSIYNKEKRETICAEIKMSKRRK